MASKNSKTNNIYINGKQAGQTLNDLRKESRKLNKEINQMAPGTEAYKKKVQELGGVKKQLTDHRNELKKVEGSYGAVSKSMGGLKTMMNSFFGIGAIIALIGGIVTEAGDWIKANAKLNASLSSLQAITGSTTKDLEFYEEEAIRMGASTTQSATQVVDAMKLIGSAKPELLQTKEALSEVTEETIRLAEAGEIEVTAAAQSLTGALNQWGKGAESAGRFTNVLAAGSKSGAADIASLGQSIDKSGSVLSGFNIEIEEGVGLLETMAEKNIKGAEAGTQLRNVLLTMQGVDALPAKAIAQLEKFGVNTDIVKDKTQPLNARLAEMAKISGDATAMMQVFGKENIVAANAILQNTEKVESYTEAVTGTNVALEQQRINNDNLEGDMKSWSSAWEGMTLTIGSGEGALRSLVQAGTDALNWVTRISKAFQDWDITKIQTELLKLVEIPLYFAEVMFGLIPGYQLYIDMWKNIIGEKIRMNELTSSVIDGMEKEQRSLSILTETIKDNNNQLEEGNLTEEETIAIKEENQKAIDILNEKYPELTANIDLQSASNEELTNWTKQASQAILDGAIAEAKAMEQKRIINEIIQETIELRKQEIKEAERWAATNWFADIFADDAEDMRKNIEKSKGQLESLEEDFKHVEGTIKDLDLNFVIDFDTANEAIDNQKRRIKSLRADIDKAKKEGNQAEIQALQAQLKAEESLEKQAVEMKKAIKQEELAEIKQIELEEQQALAEEKAAAQAKANEEAAKVQRKQLEDLKKELESLTEFETKLNQEKNREIALANKEDQERELLETQFKIDDKYKKEIDSAKALANEKGEVAAQIADKLATLELLKEEELLAAKAEIAAKYQEIEKQKETEAEKKKAEALLRIEDATWNTKMTILNMKLQETGELEIEKRRQILDEISRLEAEKAKTDFDRKIIKLQEEFDNGLITSEDQNILKEELEAEHQARLTEIQASATEERKALSDQQIQNTIDGAQTALNAISQIADAETQVRLSALEKQNKERVDKLDKALDSNLISREEYDKQVAILDNEMAEKEKKIKLEQFNRNKTLSLIQVAIDTASAIVAAMPNIPLSIAAGITGATQAAIISSQQAPQFKDGGFTTVTGAQDGKSYNAKMKGKANAGMLHGGPQLVLANEKGPEYFIPNPMLSNPEVIDHVRAIENIRVRQFAEGGATEQLPTTTADKTTGNNDQVMNALLTNLQMNNQLMSELRDQLTSLNVVIGDDKIDQLIDKMDEIESIRA